MPILIVVPYIVPALCCTCVARKPSTHSAAHAWRMACHAKCQCTKFTLVSDANATQVGALLNCTRVLLY